MDLVDLGEIPQLFYEKIVKLIQSNPEQKDILKEGFLVILNQHLETLIELLEYEQIFRCFEESQAIFINDPDVLNVLGVALNRLEKPIESLAYLRKAHQLCPKNLKIYENYENVINQWIPRWHFSMLNDNHRNTCYKKAIESTINLGHRRVLDIGTGTGLLSLYCHEAGATEIYACEEDEIMLDIASKVFRENSIHVNILPEHSTNLCLEKLQIPLFDMIVTEIFDCGAFGEGVLSTLIHAKENLLKPNGRIVPNSIEIFIVGVTSIGVGEKLECLDSTLENSIYLKNTLLIPEAEGPYEPHEQVCSQVRLVTEPVSVLTVDFNDLTSLKDAISGKMDRKVQLSCIDEDSIEGFLVYFNLHLMDEILTNFDPSGTDKKDRCWDPIIFPFNSSMPVVKYRVLVVNFSCKEGIIKVSHDYNKSEQRSLKIDSKVFDFLTDDEFMYELEYNVNKALKKNRKNYENIGDFLPFPHIGINLLKENKIKKLYCSSNVRDLVQTIAEWNCIRHADIEYIDDLGILTNGVVKFDLILLQPVTSHSTLNEEHLKYYQALSKLLTSHGMIFPYKVDICCKLIHSKWLDRVTHVTSIEDSKYGIEKHLNEYSTKHQFDFIDYDANDLSEVFTIATVQFDDKLYEKNISVNLNSTSENAQINGILHFYKIYFMSNSIAISTNRKKSFCQLNCFVENYKIKDGKSNVTINFIQNEYAFRCKIIEK